MKRTKKYLLVMIASLLLCGCGSSREDNINADISEQNESVQEEEQSEPVQESEEIQNTETDSFAQNEKFELGVKFSLDIFDKTFSDFDMANCDIYKCYNFLTDNNGVELLQPYAFVKVDVCRDVIDEIPHPSLLFINHSNKATDISSKELTVIYASTGRGVSSLLEHGGKTINSPYELNDLCTNLDYTETYIKDGMSFLIQTFKLDDTYEVTLISCNDNFSGTYIYIYNKENRNAIFNYINNYVYEIPEEYRPEGVYTEVIDDRDLESIWKDNNDISFVLGNRELTFSSKNFLLEVEGDTNYKMDDNTYSVTDIRFKNGEYSWAPYGLPLWEVDSFDENPMNWTYDIRKDSPYWFDVSSEFVQVIEDNNNCVIYHLEEDPKDDRINNASGYIVYLKAYDMYIQCWNTEDVDIVNELVEWLPDHLTVNSYE